VSGVGKVEQRLLITCLEHCSVFYLTHLLFFFCKGFALTPFNFLYSINWESHPAIYLHEIITYSVNPVILGTLDVSERGYNPVLRRMDFIISCFRKTLSQDTHNPLGYCVTSRKAASSIPDVVTGIFR